VADLHLADAVIRRHYVDTGW